MTLLRLKTLAIALCITGLSYSQTTNAFRINYDVALFDIPIQSSEALTPGNYVFSGFHANFLPIVSSLTEINSTGTVVWAKRYSGGISYMFGDYKKDNSLNRYYVCGGSGSGPAFLMFVDATGNFISGRNFSISQADGAFFNRVIKTADGGYVCVGYVTGYDPDGAGAEVDFNSVTNNNASCSEPDTETIESPLIVKFDAAGNHLWHHVARYYVTSVIPANRIYNDASFVDVVEVSDGYLAVGNYDVNNVYSTFDGECDDTTPTDAVFFKTNTAGAITYHRQIDNPSNSTGQSSKSLISASLTAAGLPLISGTDGSGRPGILMRLPGSGAWASPTWIRKYGAGNFFGTYYPFIPSRFFETSDGNYGAWLNYIPLTSFTNVLMKVNSATSGVTWAKQHSFNFASILPHGQQVSDGGYIGVSYTLAGTGHDMHFIKTDTNGDAPGACAAANVTVSNETPAYTYGTPIYQTWTSNTVTNTTIIPTVTNITPVTSVQCSFIPCTPPTAPVIGTITQPTCSVSTGSVALSGLPSSGTWTVTASPGGATITGTGTTGNFTGLAPNTYTFTVTLAGCTSVASTSAIITAAPAVPATPIIGTITQTTCSTATGSVALSGLPAGSWTVTASPGGATLNGSGTTGTFSGLAPGTYTFTVAVGAGCSSLASTSATINAQPTVPSAPIVGTITQPTCSVSTGSVAFTGLPSSGTWTLTATPGGTTSTGTGTTGTFAGLTAGTAYTFTVTNAGGCTSTASTSAALNTAPVAATAPVIGTITQPTCTVSTGSVALSGLPAGSWTVTASPGGTTTTGSGTTTTFSGLTAGTTYTFTVTNSSPCTSTASTSAILNAAPTPATTPVVGTITQPTCSVSTGSVAFTGLPSSGTWTLTATPGGTTSTGTGTTGTFAGLTAGTAYTFTVTNAGGCTSTASTSAAINTAPVAATAPVVGTITQPTCTTPNGTVDLTGLPSSGTWTVTANPGAITQTGIGTTVTFNSLPAGSSYTFTVTNNVGCTSTASTSAIINTVPGAPGAPIIGTITQPTCTVATGSVDLSGLPSTGTWTLTTTPGGSSTGTGTTTSVSSLAAGTTYTFMVMNDLGCSSSSSLNAVIIAQPITPIAPILGSITQPTCTVATGDVAISGLPSSGTWTITASPGGLTQTGTGTTGTFNGLATNTYTFTVTNSDGCVSNTSSTSAIINPQPATPTAPIAGTVTQPTCLSPTGSVDVSGLPSTTWTLTSSPGGVTQTGTGTTATFNGLAAGGTYTITVTNSAGCSSSNSTSIVVNSVPGAPTQPTAGTVTQPTCALPTGTIEVASPLGASYSYSIDGTNFQSGTTFSGLTPGNYTITVLDNTSGCSSVSTSSITIDPVAGTPIVTLVTSTSVTCVGDIDGGLEISVSGGIAPYAYAWTPNVGSGNILSNIAAGSYNVTVTDDAGCSTTATFTVGSPAAIAVNGVETNVICGASDGSIATAVSGGTSPYTYTWTPNNETTSGLTGLAAGNYSVIVTDDNGCSANESYTISTTGSLPVVIDPSYALINAGESVQLTVTGGQDYTWTPPTGLSCSDCPNPIASPTTSTTYYVTATDPNGCTGGDTILIEIKTACGELFVPTVFSPNDKDLIANNSLCVYGTPACIRELLFQVYDRWGEVVFETTDITKCWNGMYKDKLMNSGIYVYRLYVELTNGEIVDTSGNTTLVR